MAALKILILEDDITLSEALKKALQKLGHEVLCYEKAEEAIIAVKTKNIQMMYVDCLLPGQAGVEMVETIRKSFPAEMLTVVLMSGIYTDSGVMKDFTQSTHAVGFLKKPFDLKDATDLIPKSTEKAEEEVSPRRMLYQTFNRGKLSVREKRRLIESLDELHGFDLPFIYSLLVESKVSGHLNIVASNGDVSGISISQGMIVGVDIADQETFLGKLLIESGYILNEDLDQVLNMRSTKKIGERLISGNVLSPHAFNVVLSNQMNIRLSRTIVNLSVKVNFSEAEVELSSPNIDSDALIAFLHDWIAGKITLDWLKTHYTQWGNHPLLLGPAFNAESPALTMPLLTALPGFNDEITKKVSLNQILDEQKYPEEPLYKGIHLLLTKGLLVFGEAPKVVSSADAAKTLRRIVNQFNGKNKLEIYDTMVQMTNSSEQSPEKVYQDFLQMMGNVDIQDMRELKTGIEKKAKEAVDFIKSGNRDRLREEIAKNEIELKLKAASQYEEAKNLLQKAQYPQAHELITMAALVDSNLPKLKIYAAWARLGLLEMGAKGATMRDVEIDLLHVSPEDKIDALYIFVIGLFQKLSGEFMAAKKSFEKALALDAGMIVARRELSRVSNVQLQKKDMLNRDLKDIVSGLFGSKKK